MPGYFFPGGRLVLVSQPEDAGCGEATAEMRILGDLSYAVPTCRQSFSLSISIVYGVRGVAVVPAEDVQFLDENRYAQLRWQLHLRIRSKRGDG